MLAVYTARQWQTLECDLAIIDNGAPKANVAKVMNIIGEVEDVPA